MCLVPTVPARSSWGWRPGGEGAGDGLEATRSPAKAEAHGVGGSGEGEACARGHPTRPSWPLRWDETVRGVTSRGTVEARTGRPGAGRGPCRRWEYGYFIGRSGRTGEGVTAVPHWAERRAGTALTARHQEPPHPARSDRVGRREPPNALPRNLPAPAYEERERRGDGVWRRGGLPLPRQSARRSSLTLPGLAGEGDGEFCQLQHARCSRLARCLAGVGLDPGLCSRQYGRDGGLRESPWRCILVLLQRRG